MHFISLAESCAFAVQKGQYEQGKRKNPDKKRQLYKMYIALILSEIVNETPLEKIVKIFYPVDKSLVNSESAWTAHVARLEKDIGSLQVLDFCLQLIDTSSQHFIVL